jgi:hypothetical protein
MIRRRPEFTAAGSGGLAKAGNNRVGNDRAGFGHSTHEIGWNHDVCIFEAHCEHSIGSLIWLVLHCLATRQFYGKEFTVIE